MRKRCTNFLLCFAPVLVLGLAAWAQTADMPLGDLVKQPKPEKRAARIITNDDLPQHPPEPGPTNESSPTVKAEPGTKQVDAKSKTAPESSAAAEDKEDKAKDKPSVASGSAPATTANAELAKRISALTEQEAVEQKIHDRLSDALQHPGGMSDAQRQTMAEALGQSEDALAVLREQRAILQGMQSALPGNQEDKASPTGGAPSEKTPEKPALAGDNEKPGQGSEGARATTGTSGQSGDAQQADKPVQW